LPWVATSCRNERMVRRGSTVRVRQRAFVTSIEEALVALESRASTPAASPAEFRRLVAIRPPRAARPSRLGAALACSRCLRYLDPVHDRADPDPASLRRNPAGPRAERLPTPPARARSLHQSPLQHRQKLSRGGYDLSGMALVGVSGRGRALCLQARPLRGSFPEEPKLTGCLRTL
jgi:hypothetical protein